MIYSTKEDIQDEMGHWYIQFQIMIGAAFKKIPNTQ